MTHDGESPGKKTASEQWNNIVNGVADFVFDISDAEVEAELREEGVDPEAMTNGMRQVIDAAIRQAKQPRVGDVVAWADVPDGAMVRDEAGDHAVRLIGQGRWVSVGDVWEEKAGPGLWWWHQRATRCVRGTIIALGLTGNETAADLHALAERFDRIWERVQVGEGEDAVRIPAWEVAQDLADCPRCRAPSGRPCLATLLGASLYGEVHDERLAAEQQNRNG